MKLRVLIFIVSALSFVEAGLLQFRPLNAQQVYNVLRAAKREDAIPQGRVITQGIAAMTGLAAGIATGIGVPLFMNIDLANVTGITAWLSGNNAGSSGSSSASQVQTQEICFNSRAANEINDNEEDGDADDEASGDGLVLVKNESGRSYEPLVMKRRQHVREGRALRQSRAEVFEENEAPESEMEAEENYEADDEAARQVNTPTTAATTGTETGDTAASPTSTQATSPGATNTQTNTNTGTTQDGGTGTGTETATTTKTGTGGAVNCVVIQKPSVG